MEQGKMKYCPQCSYPLAPKEIRGRARLACAACSYVFYNNPTPVVAAIVEKEAKVLLVSKKEWGPGWGVLSGFPEAGETLEQAVLREVREETGLEGEVLGLVGVYSLPRRNQIFIAYRVKAKGGTLRVGKELEAIREFGRDELPQLLAEMSPGGTAWALRDWLRMQGAVR